MTEARTLAPGRARGQIVVLEAPLSFWGGMDPATGRVTDRHHPQHGIDLAGRVVVMPSGRGSSSSSSVLAEAIRAGTAPAAVVLGEPDPIVALGALVAAELYGRECPVIWLPRKEYRSLVSGMRAEVRADGDGARMRVS